MKSHEELKALLESGDAHLACAVCDAVYWVDGTDRDANGDPRLYRMAHTRIDECKICAEFADACNMFNEFDVKVSE